MMSRRDLAPEQRRHEFLAKIFDLRMFIGSLFVTFGAIVTITGLFATEAAIRKATGINLSLWTGMCMLAVGAFFVGWTFVSPPQLYQHHEFTEEDLPEQLRGRGLEHE